LTLKIRADFSTRAPAPETFASFHRDAAQEHKSKRNAWSLYRDPFGRATGASVF